MPQFFGTPAGFIDQATGFGQGLGNSLGQALVQQPYERFQLAQGLAELQQRNQQNQALNQYRMGLLNMRQDQTQSLAQARDMANQINMLRAQIDMQRSMPKPFNTPGGTYFPQGFGGGGNALPSGNLQGGAQASQMFSSPIGPQAQSGGSGMGLPTSNALQTATTEAQPNGYSFVPRPPPQANDAQMIDAGNAAVLNYLRMQGTNGVPMDMSNNIVNFARQAMGLTMPNQSFMQINKPTTNTAGGKLQRLPDGSYNWVH